MTSPRTLRNTNRSPTLGPRTQTLSQILDFSPTNRSKKDEPQDLAAFHSSLKFVPQATERNANVSPTRSPSLPKIAGSINLSKAFVLDHHGSKLDLTPESPSLQGKHILQRRGTLDTLEHPFKNDLVLDSPSLRSKRNLQRKSTLEVQFLPKQLMEPSSPTSPVKLRLLTPMKSERSSPKVMVVNSESPVRLRNKKLSCISPEQLMSERRQASQKVKDNRLRIYRAVNKSNNNILFSSRIASNQQPEQTFEKSSLAEEEHEEKKFFEKFEIDCMKNIREKLDMHNKFSPRRLFEPEEIPVDLNSFSLRPTRVTNSSRRPETPLAPEVRNELLSRRPSQPFDVLDVIKKELANTKNSSLDIKFFGELDKPLLKSQSTRALGEKTLVFKVKERIDLEKKQDPDTIKRIKEMTAALKLAKPLTTREKEFLNFVKEGKEIEEITYMVNNNKELVNIRDNQRETPLHYAARGDFIELVELLCKNGADVKAVDLKGRKPIDIALKLMNNRVIRYLEKLK